MEPSSGSKVGTAEQMKRTATAYSQGPYSKNIANCDKSFYHNLQHFGDFLE